MRKALFLFLFILCCSLVCAADFEIVSADFDITVGENGVCSIRENLVYNFFEPVHGVIREIPLDNEEIEGIRVSEDSRVVDGGSYALIQIGDEDQLIEGIHEYSIAYTLIPHRDMNAGYDEFYRDLYSTFDESVNNISFSIAFPKELSGEKIWVTAGPYGSAEQVPSYLNEGRIVSGRVDQLAPGEGLTVRVEMEDGYFEYKDWSIPAFVITLAAAAGLLVLFVYWYLRFGKDHEPVIMPVFRAPEGLSPLDVGYLFDSVDESKDYAAMIYYWADKGLIDIEEKDESFILHKKAELPDGCEDYERNLFDAVFKNGSTAELDQLNIYQEIQTRVHPLLKKKYSKGRCNLFDEKSQRLQTVSMLLVVAFALASSVCIAINDLRFGLFAFFTLAFQFVFTLLLFWQVNKKLSSRRQLAFTWVLVIFITLLSTFVINGICLSAGFGHLLVRIMTAIVTVSITVLTALSAAMPRRSDWAQDILGSIMGYRDFFKNVEIDKLKKLISEDPGYFYHNLSYAIVLDLETEWARKCDSLFTQPAGWYHGSETAASFMFYHALSRRFNTVFVQHCAAQPQMRSSSFYGSGPSRSGFSGFSGGGSGGGGSRSW